MQKKDLNKNVILSTNLFPVIGIGASAGGLEAFKKLLKAIPEDSGMAYVLVQHLDPKYDSALPELLQKVTNIPVLEITDDIKVLPDHIYIIPSNKMLLATDGILKLSPRPEKTNNKLNLPIDLFFTSLAEVHQAHAIGIVLSGNASDGTRGLKAIKDHGGITFAQDESSAAYNSMPHSAAEAGVVDFILPPEQIPQKLIDIKNQVNLTDEELQQIPKKDDEIFKQIISMLRMRKGTDFTFYKQTTIRRRILRRMAINKYGELSTYLVFLRDNNSEQDALYYDLLIPVTDFFRDSIVFDNLCESVFPHILKNKTPGESVRIWVAGCSTGQEAYSIAMCLKEFLGDSHENIQIFATDISEPAIAKARTGIYTKNEVKGISPQRLQEFFTRTNGHFQINKSLRNLCVFAVHNFLKDPPFGKIDFISCRNVLIYMETYLQKKALTTFHYSLNEKGFLLLGKSETSGSLPKHFMAAGKSDKLYTRIDVPGTYMHVASQRSEQTLHALNTSSKKEHRHTNFQKTADEILLNKYTPPGVVVNDMMDIVHFRGNTSQYLEQAPGKPSHHLLKMAKAGLAFELRNLIHKVKKDRIPVIKENILFHIDGNRHYLCIETIPLPDMADPHYLIMFHKQLPATAYKSKVSKSGTSSKIEPDENELHILQLEQELLHTHEDMRSITEDQEAANEELQSANEELLSGSEEMQSLNEELESSKEELQSTNEELTVLNQKLNNLNGQVTAAKDYAENIIANIREPLLVLDKNLRIKTANNAFYKTFRVNEPETEGILIYDLGNKQWNIPSLRKLLENILPDKFIFNDFEVTHTFSHIGERIMLLNAREILNKTNSEKLILLSIEDITEKAIFRQNQELFTQELEKKVQERTTALQEANEELIQKNQEIALSIYNKRFLSEFSEKFTVYKMQNEFFSSLVQFIANTTHLDYVLVGKLVKNEHNESAIQTIAFSAFGKLAENIHYPLKNGPFEQIIQNKIYSFPGNCRNIFPNNVTIAQFNVEGYISYPLFDEQGNAVGLIALMHQKKIEDPETTSSVLKIVARRAEIELERIKQEELLVKHNEILEEKNRELLKLNTELESFNYVSSHDLQEPLRKIQTFAARILETEYAQLTDMGKNYFQRMNNAARRMQKLIEDLLSYSHTNGAERKFVNTDLNLIIEAVKSELKETIEGKNAIIESKNLCNANIQPFQFHQLMINLIGNALKFSTPDKQPHIIIKSEQVQGSQLQNEEFSTGKISAAKNYCHISIADNGSLSKYCINCLNVHIN